MEQQAKDVGETGQFDEVAVATNTVSKTDWALRWIHVLYTPSHMFYIIYSRRFWALLHTGALIATAEQRKVIATAVQSLCGSSTEKKKKHVHRSK